MYKILAMNSLIYAYSMSAMYLDGIKTGDWQATLLGLGMGAMFMMISLSKPLPKLSHIRPPKKLFHWSFVSSVILQSIFHLTTLIYILRISDEYVVRDETIEPDADFSPNIRNSVVFLYEWVMVATTFLVNYEGAPIMQSLKENGKLYKTLMGMYGLAIVLCFDLIEELREYFEMVKFPNETF